MRDARQDDVLPGLETRQRDNVGELNRERQESKESEEAEIVGHFRYETSYEGGPRGDRMLGS